MRPRLPLVVSLLSAGSAAAQPEPVPGDPLGPVRCYAAATQDSRAAMEQAKLLCIGAVDESPARCFAQAAHREFADAQAIQLCAGTTSLAPATCADRLKTTAGLDDGTIVAYCAALPWPLAPLAGPGAPRCVLSARDRTRLPDSDAVRLCSGSTSAAPVDCYAWGEANTYLSDHDLVDLCLPAALYPYPP
jgi:hypothetical protein